VKNKKDNVMAEFDLVVGGSGGYMSADNLDLLFNSIGTAGVFCILLAYFLMQTGRVRSEGIKYSAINLTGAILILISLFRHWNLPSAIIQICWIIISFYGIYKATKKVNK